jgi:hypothetical protein
MFHRPGGVAAVLLCLLFLAPAFLPGQTGGDDAPQGKKKGAFGGKAKAVEIRPYDEVITKKAKSTPGVFAVHRLNDKIYYEIPTDVYGKLMLWTTEIAKAPSGVGWGGSALGNRVVKWDRRGNRIYLWEVSFAKRGDGSIARAVDSATMGSIIMSFPVEAEGKEKSAVIDVTKLFTSDVAEFSAKRLVTAAAGVDDSRSYIEEVKSFPTNIETRSLLTFRMGGGGGGLGKGEGPKKGKGGGKGGNLPSVSVLVHYSMTLLPDRPMQGRFFDPRVGYFVRSFEDYSSNKNWVETRKYINRFRLEKKDPDAAVSEPVKPIVFYISREVPDKWKPYVKKGVEDWQPVFEKVGFKNAIFCKEAPTDEEDPNWDPEDARYSVIRWVAMPIKNAMGPHVHDPRSGEVISAHIIMWHDVLKLAQMWYFAQCGAVDPRAQKLPLPDDLTGDLLRYVVTHEVGHTLGLRHNHRASSAYKIADLRNPAFAAKYGTVGSIMSYGRFNYVAQPEDNVKWLIPKVAPYDYFAIEWGYKSLPECKSPEAELPILDRMAARQIEDPYLRFGGEDGPATVDPTVKRENIGTDSIEATALGLKNLDRVTDMLVSATSRLGEDYSLLQEAYQEILTTRRFWFDAVATLVGGVVESRTLAGRGDETFSRVPREKQRVAVKFLLENALTTPKKLLQPAIINRFKYFGVADAVMNQQKALMQSLLSGRRFKLLMDSEAMQPDKSYAAIDFLKDVQDGLWSELKDANPKVDVVRRSLQRAYLEHIKSELTKKDAAPAQFIPPGGEDGIPTTNASTQQTDFRAVARAALRLLRTQLQQVPQDRVPDAMTRVHLEDCLREIDLILNPKS